MAHTNKAADAAAMVNVKHDIKNQLSNIIMLLDQLKYELRNAPSDQLDYLDMIELSATKIDAILNSTD